jgi:hypothetical protein
MERSLHCTFNELQRRSGERHENLPADDADRYPFDSRSLHLGSGTAIENAASVIAVVVFFTSLEAFKARPAAMFLVRPECPVLAESAQLAHY